MCVVSLFHYCLDAQKLSHIYSLTLEWILIINDMSELNSDGLFHISVDASARAAFYSWSPNDFKEDGRRSPGCGPQDTHYTNFIFLVFQSPLNCFTSGKLHESLIGANVIQILKLLYKLP